MKKNFTIYLIFQFIGFLVFAQCDAEKEYSSEYYHSTPFSFLPANVDRIEDSKGDFYELLFVDDSIQINNHMFDAGANNLFSTSGILVRKISQDGTTIYNTFSFFKSQHPPLITPSRSSSNHITLNNDSLCIFGLIEPGDYKTKKGNISIQYRIFGKTTFDPIDGHIYDIKTIINGFDANLSISSFSIPMIVKDDLLAFSFGSNKDFYDNISKKVVQIENGLYHLFMGSYDINNNTLLVDEIGKSKKRISPYTISKNQFKIFVSGIYTDSLYLNDGSILLPEKDTFVNSSTDGFLIVSSSQLKILNFLSIKGSGSFNHIFTIANLDGTIGLFLNALNNKIIITNKNKDSLISKSWNSFFLFDNDLNIKALKNINYVSKTEGDYFQINMFKVEEDKIVLSITTNSEKIIYDGDIFPTLHKSEQGYTLFHIYIDNNGKRIKHQTYYSEGFFTLYPLHDNEDITYFNGTQNSDIKGSFEMPFPNDAPFRNLTFMKNICNDKLIKTQKIKTLYFGVYPNPFFDVLNFSDINEPFNVSIYNLLGNKIITKYYSNEDIKSVDLSHLQPGMYLVKLQFNSQVAYQKIIKK